MKKTAAGTVREYLDAIPEERRDVVRAVREVILASLPEGYEESLSWGMLCYEVPLERYPHTYNSKPLSYAALAVQKNHIALYLMGVYQSAERAAWLRGEFERAGKKLDMGKACVRFRTLDDLPLDVIGRAIGAVPPDVYIAEHEAARRR